MISFRFHLVSLVAVFLALGLGVLTGTTVVNQGIVARLEDQTNELDVQADQLRGEVEQLEATAAQWEEFGETVLPRLAGARLTGQPAVLVTQEGTDQAALDRVREALDVAGAELVLELRLGRRMALEGEDDETALAEALGGITGDADELALAAAQDVADELSFGPPPGGEDDVIGSLVASGFLSSEGSLTPSGERPLDDPLVVVVAGGPEQPVVSPGRFLIPVVERLAGNGREVVAAEPQRSSAAFVSVLRERAVAEEMATVDHADRLPGVVALVLAAEDLLEEGLPGHYGVKAGASSLLPPL